ncbi:MAG: hypothetical protein IJN52_02350 [Bacteroidales bacterium]|nr:hypothetical protein [Bacteroidales bacterium]
MKKFLMTLAMAAAMVAAVSCACNNGSDKAACDKTECADCADCDGCTKAADDCCDAAGTCDEACDKACDKSCDNACDKKCEKAEGCDKKCEKHGDKQCCEKKAGCDSTCVDCKKAE